MDERRSSTFWGRVLDNIPGISGKRAYDRAQGYIDRTHFNPEDSDEEMRAGNKSYDLLSRISQYNLEEDDTSKHNQISLQALGFPTGMPERFLYQNALENDDISAVNQVIKGTKAGTIYEEDDVTSRAIDKDYVVSPKAGKYFMGVIPYGWLGGMRKNPGIPHRVDPSYFRKSMRESGTAPISRLELYSSNSGDFR